MEHQLKQQAAPPRDPANAKGCRISSTRNKELQAQLMMHPMAMATQVNGPADLPHASIRRQNSQDVLITPPLQLNLQSSRSSHAQTAVLQILQTPAWRNERQHQSDEASPRSTDPTLTPDSTCHTAAASRSTDSQGLRARLRQKTKQSAASGQ